MLNLTTYKTKSGAAKALAKQLKKVAAKWDVYNPDDVRLYNPKEAERVTGHRYWTVVWENGPYYWAEKFSLNMKSIEEFFDMTLFNGEYTNWYADTLVKDSIVFFDLRKEGTL